MGMLDPQEALDPFVREGGTGSPADRVSKISGVVIRSAPKGKEVTIPSSPDIVVEAVTIDEAARLALAELEERKN